MTDNDLWGDLTADEPPVAAVPWSPAEEPVSAVQPASAADPWQTAAATPDTGWDGRTGAPIEFENATEETDGFIFEEEDPFALTEDELPGEAPSAAGEAHWDEFEEEILPLDDGDIIEEEMLVEEPPVDPRFASTFQLPPAAETAVWEFAAEETEDAPVERVTDEMGWDFEDEPVTAPALAEAGEWPEATLESALPSPAAWEQVDEAAAPPAAPVETAATVAETAATVAEPAATAVETKAATLSEEELARIVEKVAGAVIERLAPILLERIAWEVVPDLAESLIRDEIRKLKEEVENQVV
ncbi:MAG: hypothetical protein IH614_19465 [Desulfuromonadales bacterium]|nr:hypothetical protein [Desulfuromonadales bacterium]